MAAAGLTAIVVDVALVKLPLVKLMVMLVATLCARLVNVANPFEAVAVSLPCNVPLPALRVAVTTVVLLFVSKWPAASSMRITGCCAKSAPAVAVVEGWVWMTRRTAGPYSINWPKLVLLSVTPAIVDVPVLVILPLARGLATVGGTRVFCQVSEHVTSLALSPVTLNRICVVVREAMATEVPLATELMFLLSLPLPVNRSIRTVGAVPPVSKMNPLGAFR